MEGDLVSDERELVIYALPADRYHIARPNYFLTFHHACNACWLSSFDGQSILALMVSGKRSVTGSIIRAVIVVDKSFLATNG